MRKKRGDRTIWQNKARKKKAQITVFMIIGILLLFMFIFMIKLTSTIKTSQLEMEKEKVFTKAFKKEAMRIFIEDCLNDELERGLILLGKQGRIWDDQPGGKVSFLEGYSGITYLPGEEGGRVYYGINQEHYNFFNAYPCANETFSPHFCQYQFPNINLGFGTLGLKPNTIESDLKNYLIDKTILCVNNYTKTNISSKAKIETTKMKMKLDLQDEGISVNVDYPLKFVLGGEEFFHLSTFDFFYPTQFKKLVSATVGKPLENDYKFLDFNYSQEVLENHYFTYANPVQFAGCEENKNYYLCNRSILNYNNYKNLAVDMQSEELPNGDNIYTFTPALHTIINKPIQYFFRIARQNRAPALDYVNRSQCIGGGYDYLVIKDEDSSFGEINISLFALDPDEDNVSFNFEDYSPINPTEISEKDFYVSKNDLDILPAGFYNLTANSSDEHDLNDWQTVRILFDQPMTMNLSLSHPYEDLVTFYGGVYLVSNEDPAFVNITLPEGSSDASREVIINYNNQENSENIFTVLPVNLYGQNNCFSFPWANTHPFCHIDDYNEEELNDWKTLLDEDLEFGNFKETTEFGLLNLSLSSSYCESFNSTKSVEIPVVVKACLPHQNPEYPFAYNPQHKYHQYQFGIDETNNNLTNFSDFKDLNPAVNPYESTHSCCAGQPDNPFGWKLKTENDTPCFENPLDGCYNGITGFTNLDNYGGYLLEEEFRYCDGLRGNTCQGERKTKLINSTMICGYNDDPNYPGCEDIAETCQGELSFSLIENEGWCHGKMGCDIFCTSAITYTGLEPNTYFPSKYINNEAEKIQLLDEKDNPNFPFKCGCSSSNEGKPCDTNFDGSFEGTCKNGGCFTEICDPGQLACDNEKKNIVECNDEGTKFEIKSSCASGEFCSGGECQEQVCVPSGPLCFNDEIEKYYNQKFDDEGLSDDEKETEKEKHKGDVFVCEEPGSGYTESECESGESCSGGVCT